MRIGRMLILMAGLGARLAAQIPDFTPSTPLLGALLHKSSAEARRLLAEGADPNEGRLNGFPPVFFAILHQDLDLVRTMVEKGADVRARDASGSTTLMWASFNETGDVALVNELLRLGVNPHAVNRAGETALTWASRRGHTEIEAALRGAGASDSASIQDSVQRAISLLQQSDAQFRKVSGCVSCHHQFLPQMALSVARDRGFQVNEESVSRRTEATIALVEPVREELVRNRDRLPDPPVTASYALLALAADDYPDDKNTRALASLIANWQHEDGMFPALPMRPPIEGSHFTATALSLRALQIYGKHPEKRVAHAATWLRRAGPKTTEDRAMQLLGLKWAGVTTHDVGLRARALLAEQRPDGGWPQLPGLESDAYATGQALAALYWGGHLAVSDAAYQRGVGFLLRTQFADGSWLVRTRSFPAQAYKESGFPHGKDQWISAAGTSWAIMALSLALPAGEGAAEFSQEHIQAKTH